MVKGRHYRYRKLDIWAERGIINIVDERFPSSHLHAFNTCVVREFLLRLQALSKEVKEWEKKWPDEREELVTFIEDGLACVQDAKAQGRPDNPTATAQMLRERRRFMLYAGTGSTAPGGALSSAVAPESVILPPIPQANPNKPITPLVDSPTQLNMRRGSFSKLFV